MRSLHIPAAPAFLRGYCGGTIRRCAACGGKTIRYDRSHNDDRCSACGGAPARVFNASLAPVRDHVARVMSAGARCSGCKGTGLFSAAHPFAASARHDAPLCHEPCHGSGYLLRPAPIEHLLDRPGSRLTAEQSAVLVAWSARSWLRGGEVLRGCAGEWVRKGGSIPWRRMTLASDGSVGARTRAELVLGFEIAIYIDEPTTGDGWWIVGNPDKHGAHGPETGPEGRTCADAALLAANIAYIEQGSVVTPEDPNV